MFFIPTPNTPHTWETNWEIRVTWPGTLATTKTKSKAPDDYYERNSLETGTYLPSKDQLPWDIRPIYKHQYNYLPKDKYYLEPFLLFSFFPYQSLTQGKVLKLHFGFTFWHQLWKVQKNELWTELQDFTLMWGMAINDQLKKGCTVHRNDDPITWGDIYARRKTTYQWQTTYQPHQPIVHPRKPWITYDSYKFILNKPFLIPLSCLKKGKQNTIKIWWSSKHKHNEELIPELTNIKIDFYYPNNNNLDLTLKPNLSQNIYLHQWYLITTKLGQRPQIISLQQQLIKIKSYLLTSYPDNQPFQSTWEIEYHPIQITYRNWQLLLQYFQFSNFSNDLTKTINWSFIKPENHIETTVLSQNQKHLLQNRLALLGSTIQTIQLAVPGFKKQQEKSKLIRYQKYHYQNIFTTKNSWNPITKKIITNSASPYTFLIGNDYQNNLINLSTSFVWKNIITINFLITQNLMINNMFLFQKLILDNQTVMIKPKPSPVSITFEVNNTFLKEIANSSFSFHQYQAFRQKYGKYYVKKDH